jgi:hypothetical protein
MKISLSLAAALSLALALPARAGVTFVQTYEEIGGQKPAVTNTIHLDKDRVRIDAGLNPDTYFIYRGDKKAFYTVNLKDKSYMEMTEKDFQEMMAKMDEAKKKMAETLEKLPPEQRKSMEAMMAKMMPGAAAAPKITYKKLGSGGSVNGWNTDKYEGARDGEKSAEIWTAAPKSLDINEADFQVLKDMGKFFEKFAQNFQGMIGDKSNGLDGVPVKTVSFKDGKPHFQSIVKEVKKENQPASLFEIPAGLTMKKMGKPQ